MKILFRLLMGLALIVGLTLLMISCDPNEEDPVDCTGCTANNPYKNPSGSTNCYPTLEDCENAEGAGCEVCN